MATEKPRKRQLEVDEDYGEGDDQFDSDACTATRRGRKEARRVSGVIREIQSLQNIGENASVMEQVFDRMSLRDVMWTGSLNTKWYILACHTLRKRFGEAPLLRLWNAEKPPSYLWMEWELHFHQQLLAGMDEEELRVINQNARPTSRAVYPRIESIISVGSRSTYDQFVDEDAKLPFRQEHLYFTCGNAIITTPDYSYTGMMDGIFPWGSLTVQSLFIPKNPHFCLKIFSLDASVDAWNLDMVKEKIEFPKEDVGEGLEMKGVFFMEWNHNTTTRTFIETFQSNFKTLGLMSGSAEEIGCNRGSASCSWAVGCTLYANDQAEVGMYEIDFEKQDYQVVLEKVEHQAKSKPNGFCFVLTYDNREEIVVPDVDEDGDWTTSHRPPCRVNELLNEVRKRMPKIPIIGLNSDPWMKVQTRDATHTNVRDGTEKRLCFGMLLVTF